ncbi:MAG: hypothetical protein ABFD92_02045 [Planctomycetaceae bacterium]|nr:hypothetical protein [Planctomycetaceae bacterium]
MAGIDALRLLENIDAKLRAVESGFRQDIAPHVRSIGDIRERLVRLEEFRASVDAGAVASIRSDVDQLMRWQAGVIERFSEQTKARSARREALQKMLWSVGGALATWGLIELVKAIIAAWR